jgi:glycosyltransferase involved in cell wall biosynthesis
MRVVFDYQTFSIRQYSGISRYFVELAAALGRLGGVDARVVAPLAASRFLAERRGALRVSGLDVSQLEWLPMRAVRGVNRILFPQAARLEQPEILHETGYALHRSSPRGVRIVTTMHDTIPERLPERFSEIKQHRRMIRAALERADAVICVSESTRRDVAELYGVAPERMTVVHLASALEPAAAGPAEDAKPYFLHVGTRYPYKNFGVLVKAFGMLGLARTHRLIAFSSHEFTDDELKAMDRAGVARECVLRVSGDDAKLARYYAGATALVLPSLYEGFGIPVVEAMRCGCPVIASETSSLPEVGGEAAVYCDPLEPESLAAAMRRVAEDSALRTEMTMRGQKQAALFSWERCAQETCAVYRELLAR